MRFYAPKTLQTDTRTKPPSKTGNVKSTEVWDQRKGFTDPRDPDVMVKDDLAVHGFLNEVQPTDVSPGGRDYKGPVKVPPHTHAARDIVSGLISTARLGTGTASASTFLRGDQSWQPASGLGIQSFRTIACPTGTNPVADSSADTLTLLAGPGITINGNAAADSVEISASIAAQNTFTTFSTPAGSDVVADTDTDTLTFLDGTGINITGDGINDTITIDVDPTEIDHDQLLNFVADEHVPHTSVTLTAGSGLSGGGDISASRTFDVNVDSTTIEINSDTLRRAAISGDASVPAGSATLTLATVNANVGSFGDATNVAAFTVNAKGLITAASNVPIVITTGSITNFTEDVQDAVGAMVTDGSLVYVDATPLLTRGALTGDVTAAQGSNSTTIDTNAVTDAKFRQSAALSVVGRAANSTGNVADISTTSLSNGVLRENGGTLSFGQVQQGGIASDAVGDLQLRNSGPLSVIGRDANSTGNPGDISSSANNQVLRRTSNTLNWGAAPTSGHVIARIVKAIPPATLFAQEYSLAGISTPAESINVFAFDDATVEYMDYLCEMSPQYAGGGLTVRLCWTSDSATSNETRWGVAFRRFADDAEDINGAAQTYDYNEIDATAPSTTSRKPIYDSVTFDDGSDMDSVAAGETFLLRIKRNASHANDDMTGDAFLISVSIRER